MSLTEDVRVIGMPDGAGFFTFGEKRGDTATTGIMAVIARTKAVASLLMSLFLYRRFCAFTMSEHGQSLFDGALHGDFRIIPENAAQCLQGGGPRETEHHHCCKGFVEGRAIVGYRLE